MKQNLQYLICLLLCGLVSIGVLGQTSISGKIVDEEGLELIGANILIKGTAQGTITDLDGKYALSIPEGYNTIVVSYIGYQEQEIDITGKSVVDIALQTNSLLDEVVVLGYGRQKKSVVTGAISSIDIKDIENISAGQLQSSIQGRSAGINILPNSGSPGAGFKVRIRGTGSNGNSEPLYIVDGMRTRDISYLSSDEIANIEILKDAATAAIYGAEGANGVVIVSTKRGGSETAGIQYTTQFGVQSYKSNLDLMSADQHAQYMEDAGIGGRTTADIVNNTNWIDEIFETAPLQRHALGFNGGNENMNYYLQGSFFNQDGIIVGDKDRFQRFGLRANIDNKVNNWLKVGVSMNYTHSNRKGVSEDSEFGGILANAILMDPNTPVTYTGELPDYVATLRDSSGISLLQDANGNYYGLSNFVDGEIYNPVAGTQLVNGKGTTSDRILGSVYGTIRLMENLNFTSRFGIDNDFIYFHNWSPRYFVTTTRQDGRGSASQNHVRNMGYQWENFVNYDKDFGNLGLAVVLGTSLYSYESNSLNTFGSGLARDTDLFGYVGGVEAGAENTTVSGIPTLSNLLSYFGRVSLDISEKYLLTATLRRDGSSLLADGSKWGNFPSVSAGWVVSREDFFPSSGVLSYLKVRGSWGQNGSLANLTPGAWNSAIGFGDAYPDGTGALQTAASPTILNNPSLTWETSEQLDIGIDIGFWDDRVNLTFDYFDKQTKNLLNTGVIPDFIGNSAPTVNLGDIANTGFEVELGFKNKLGNGLDYNISANYTRLKNEVVRLDENLDFATGTRVGVGWNATAFEQGLPAWYFRGYETDGVFQSQSEVDSYVANTMVDGGNPVPGDPKIVDVNGDGAITPDDQTFIGSPHPDALYGVRLGADFKGLDFAFFLQGSVGNDILLGYNRTDRATSNKPAFFAEDSWSESNTSGSWFRANGSNPYAYNSDFMVFDGSYARIKQIQVGYTLGLENAKIAKSARVYVSLEDFFTFTNYQGLDPETGSANDNSLGIDRGVYPLPRKMLVGLSVKF